MLKHAIDRHEDTDPEHLEFRMKVLKYHRSACERQVSESMEIKKNSRHHILNSKGEYNRCALPRLGLKIGTKEYSKAKNEEDMEAEKEKNIEEKIRMMRKKAGKTSNSRNKKETSAPKRRKVNELNDYIESRIVDFNKIVPNTGEKRADREEMEEQSKPKKIKIFHTSKRKLTLFYTSQTKTRKNSRTRPK